MGEMGDVFTSSGSGMMALSVGVGSPMSANGDGSRTSSCGAREDKNEVCSDDGEGNVLRLPAGVLREGWMLSIGRAGS